MKDIDLIEKIGGVSKVAKICQITPSAVSQWKKNGIPKAQVNFLNLYIKQIDIKKMGAKNDK